MGVVHATCALDYVTGAVSSFELNEHLSRMDDTLPLAPPPSIRPMRREDTAGGGKRGERDDDPLRDVAEVSPRAAASSSSPRGGKPIPGRTRATVHVPAGTGRRTDGRRTRKEDGRARWQTRGTRGGKDQTSRRILKALRRPNRRDGAERPKPPRSAGSTRRTRPRDGGAAQGRDGRGTGRRRGRRRPFGDRTRRFLQIRLRDGFRFADVVVARIRGTDRPNDSTPRLRVPHRVHRAEVHAPGRGRRRRARGGPGAPRRALPAGHPRR